MKMASIIATGGIHEWTGEVSGNRKYFTQHDVLCEVNLQYNVSQFILNQNFGSVFYKIREMSTSGMFALECAQTQFISSCEYIDKALCTLRRIPKAACNVTNITKICKR